MENYLIQGTSKPITLKFNEEIEFEDISIALTNLHGVIKHWGLNDIEVIDASIIQLPLTQTESLNFAEGRAFIEIKWLDGEATEFAKLVEIEILKRQDTTILA